MPQSVPPPAHNTPIFHIYIHVNMYKKKKPFNNVKRLYMKPDDTNDCFFSFISIAFAHDENCRTNWVSSHRVYAVWMKTHSVCLRVQLYVDDGHGFGVNVIDVVTVVSLCMWQYIVDKLMICFPNAVAVIVERNCFNQQ